MNLRTTKLVKYREEIKAAYEAGGTLQNIANLYNVATGTVRNELIAQGVPRRRRGRGPKVITADEAQPEFKLGSLDGVPVAEVPEIPAQPVPVEPVEGSRVIIDNDDPLNDIFGNKE